MTVLQRARTRPDPGKADPTGARRSGRSGGEKARPAVGPRAGRAAQLALVLAALAALVTGGLWLAAATDDSLELAAERDAALVDARQAAITLNTLDFTDVDGGLDRWEHVSTGPVLDEFRTNRAQYAQFVAQAKRTTAATVTNAAVSEIDPRAGTARVLVGVDVTVTPQGQQPVLTRQRLQLEMTRTDDGWKVSRLAPVRAPTAAS